MSSIQFEGKLSTEVLKKKMQEKIDRMEKDLSFIDLVFNACEKYEGKQITKRIEGELKKHLPDYVVYLRREYGMFNIVIWGKDVKYEGRFSALLGYENNEGNKVNIEQIRGYNTCHTANTERIERLKSGFDQVDDLVKRWNDGISALQEVNKEAEKFYLDYDICLQTGR